MFFLLLIIKYLLFSTIEHNFIGTTAISLPTLKVAPVIKQIYSFI